MITVAIIPARYGSTRLPGKALADLAGKPMIQHVYERAQQARAVQRVLVATDDARIYQAVQAFGGEAAMTSATHRSGTDRVAEVAAGLTCELVVNVQGDEPLIRPEMIDAAVQPLLEDETLPMSTLKVALEDENEIRDPSVVKVVTDQQGNALYFSRHPIPYCRAGREARWFQHIGLYAYRRSFLLQYARMAPTPLQLSEDLEQLRALENGYRIKVLEVPDRTIGVDTPEDLARVRDLLAKTSSGVSCL